MSEPVAVVTVSADEEGYKVDVHTELGPEVLADLLRQAADQVDGKGDRARGAWGRV